MRVAGNKFIRPLTLVGNYFFNNIYFALNKCIRTKKCVC